MASEETEITTFRQEYQRHLSLVCKDVHEDEAESQQEELERAPLFGSDVVWDQNELPTTQYGLLGEEKSTRQGATNTTGSSDQPNLIYGNTDEPWSTFICGSQGSGKSHTLANLLENCVLPDLEAGKNPKPLAAIAFHYDQFTSFSSTQHCELAYLCSAGIKVRILVSPSNFENMKKLYTNMPGLPESSQPKVIPFKLGEKHLNIENTMTLMNVKENDSTPLYLAVIWEILRRMAASPTPREGIDYKTFRNQINAQQFLQGQTTMLDMRLNLLDSLLDTKPEITGQEDVWSFKPGTLTIVDLSSPFVNAADACALFAVCLNLFMAGRGKVGRVVVLDEAHKFLTATGEAEKLTDSLLAIIRQQRHLAARVMIATQEPTLDHRRLDLCNVVIVHRFNSLAWFSVLQGHLAGSRRGSDRESTLDEIFRTIVGLKTGTALIFSPTAVLHAEKYEEMVEGVAAEKKRLIRVKDRYVQTRIRARITQDGGKSIKATDGKDDPSDDTNYEGPMNEETSGDTAPDLNPQTSNITSSSRSDRGLTIPEAPAFQGQSKTMPDFSVPSTSLTPPQPAKSAEEMEQLVRQLVEKRMKKGHDNSKISPLSISNAAAKEMKVSNRTFKKMFSHNKMRSIVADRVLCTPPKAHGEEVADQVLTGES